MGFVLRITVLAAAMTGSQHPAEAFVAPAQSRKPSAPTESLTDEKWTNFAQKTARNEKKIPISIRFKKNL